MAEPTQESLDKNRKFVQGFAEKSGTAMHPNTVVTEAVVKGLASHIDELGKPLCPCNFYKDKEAEEGHVGEKREPRRNLEPWGGE